MGRLEKTVRKLAEDKGVSFPEGLVRRMHSAGYETGLDELVTDLRSEDPPADLTGAIAVVLELDGGQTDELARSIYPTTERLNGRGGSPRLPTPPASAR